jgi:penicillin amidase
MKKRLTTLLILLIFIANANAQTAEPLSIKGLQQPVEILIDTWGIPHIYAQNEADLFFAQGFTAARDRLFQFELWRRSATGTVAELLGTRELKRDIGTRLFKFRGDLKKELNHYHPNGELIITSFVNGVNAYIELTQQKPELLPIEFKLLNIKPQKWTPEIVTSRHQGLLGNIKEEIRTAQAVAKMGVAKVKEQAWFHPGDPILDIDPKIDTALFSQNIIAPYEAYRKGIVFQPTDLIAEARTDDWEKFRALVEMDEKIEREARQKGAELVGSNNWVVSGERTQSGFPMLANDPHRAQSAPSLRYISHLVAPGWNVIGGGEPTIPGISIGHNEQGAWGLTIFGTDAEDLYVYRTNPQNPNQYWYKGAWENMTILKDTIRIKGQQKPEIVELKYTRHGPVTYENPKKNQACALRCGWLEVGGAPYLASLRMNQAKTWEEFREACNYSHIPGENMIWADKNGNIGWQAVGITPVRRNFSGMVPVPGDGSYEWEDYQEIKNRPNSYNPSNGFITTANENVTPRNYPDINATIGFTWAEPYRGDRIREVLGSGQKFTMMDMMQLQTDYLSIPARMFVPLLKNVKIADNETAERARQMLLNWNFQLDKNSVPAAIYVAWEARLYSNVREVMVPPNERGLVPIQAKRIADWLLAPDGRFGKNPVKSRDELVVKSLKEAVYNLNNKLGTDVNRWQYGQEKYKHVLIKHPLSNAVKEDVRKILDVGPAPRGGNGHTVNSTGNNDNQTHGASFRIITDLSNWNFMIGTNTPGQSGNPAHPHYRNLFDIWANDGYFPMFYTREKIEAVRAETILLQPK